MKFITTDVYYLFTFDCSVQFVRVKDKAFQRIKIAALTQWQMLSLPYLLTKFPPLFIFGIFFLIHALLKGKI